MLLGSSISLDLAYRVLPGIQDRLSSFPVATIFNRIIRDWPTLRPRFALFTTPDLYRKLNQLYGAYALAIAQGAKRYELSDRNPRFKIASFIMQQTGIDRQTVVAFLSTLEKLAKEGAISFEYWDPKKTAQLNKAVTVQTKSIRQTEPKNVLERVADDTAKTVKWVLVIALLAGGGYALSQVKAFVPRSKK